MIVSVLVYDNNKNNNIFSTSFYVATLFGPLSFFYCVIYLFIFFVRSEGRICVVVSPVSEASSHFILCWYRVVAI